MTAQAQSRDLDTDDLVLLVDHLGKLGDLVSSFVRTARGVGRLGYHIGVIITSVDDAQAMFGDIVSDIRSWDQSRPIDPEDALTPRLAKLQDGIAETLKTFDELLGRAGLPEEVKRLFNRLRDKLRGHFAEIESTRIYILEHDADVDSEVIGPFASADEVIKALHE